MPHLCFVLSWKILKSTFKTSDQRQSIGPRARALLVNCTSDVVPPRGGLFACGGFHKNTRGELVPIGEILCYDKSSSQWELLADIPNLTKSSILAIDNNILTVSQLMKSEHPDAEDELVPEVKYDLVRRKWLMLNGKAVEETNEAPK
jgi:hypothetical protein